jgi:hypothetical protein
MTRKGAGSMIRDSDIERLELFLGQRFGFKIPQGVEFRKMSQDKLDTWLRKNETDHGKIVSLSMNDFLTEECYFNSAIEKVVSETIQGEGLIIYAGIVSYEERGEAALSTGGNTYNNLKPLEEQGLITRFLSYQGTRENPSPLCEFALKEEIKVYFVDDFAVSDKNENLMLETNARGKTENILKFTLMLNKEVQAANLDPGKVFVLFLDDDYTLIDEHAHYILIASWVLSFAKSNSFGIEGLLNNCRHVGFVKNGGVRIHFPSFLSNRIIRGEAIKNYRSLIIEVLKLDIDLGETDAEASLRNLIGLIDKITNLPSKLILTPENLPLVVSHAELMLIRKILKKFFYSGGRVTKPFTRKNVHESENFLSDWLGRFTFILHGDQGTTLKNWLLMKLGQGYAFDSSVIIQFLLDENFADQRIADLQNTPHAHQPQEQPKVEGMENLINLDTETLRVYYGNWDVDSFINRYQKRTMVSWLADGRYIRTKVQPEKGILFYPAAVQLKIC